jgi:hypothetical protein
MPTILGIAGVSKAIPANRDALSKFCHTVYHHIGGNEDTLH